MVLFIQCIPTLVCNSIFYGLYNHLLDLFVNILLQKCRTVYITPCFQQGGAVTSHSSSHCTVVMAEFAQALFEVLETLNKNSFTQFKLRIGKSSHGFVYQ